MLKTRTYKTIVRMICLVLLMLLVVAMFMLLKVLAIYLEIKSINEIWPAGEYIILKYGMVSFAIASVVFFIRMVWLDFKYQSLARKVKAGKTKNVEEDDEEMVEEAVIEEMEVEEITEKSDEAEVIQESQDTFEIKEPQKIEESKKVEKVVEKKRMTKKSKISKKEKALTKKVKALETWKNIVRIIYPDVDDRITKFFKENPIYDPNIINEV